jgi:hypothetical protein
MKLDIASFGNAVRRLREGLARCEREPADEQIRDGLIQRFDSTYELGHKMLRRYLKETAASPDEVERMPFAGLVRAAKLRACCGATGRSGGAFAKCVPAPVTLTMPTWFHRSPRRSRGFWKKHLYAELQRRLA